MQLFRICFIVFFSVIALHVSAQSDGISAFPGAEGFAKYITGGRGGEVIYVTHLEDDHSEGSFRKAVEKVGSRIIVFKVSGTIQLKSELKISNSNLTIAGQTAPGDGITIRDYPVIVNADNVVIRFLRFRMGDETAQEADALGGRSHKNILIDHCSISWSTDECASFYDNENFTMQWCIISESLRNSVHEKGEHGYGGIWGGQKATFHHNLLASHDSRNPRFCGSRYSNQPEKEQVDFRNNVIYNWGNNSAYAAEGGNYNLINNYYKAGPATSSSKSSRIIQPYCDNGGNSQPAGTYGKFFIHGNEVTASASVTTNNWNGVSMHSTFSTYAPAVTKNDLVLDTEVGNNQVTTHSAEDAYAKVLQFAGASLIRDAVDVRVIQDVENGTATYTDGGNGSTNGIIDTQEAVGGWPELQSAEAPLDSDNDGMPDDWETAQQLNSSDPADAQLTTVDGVYPNIEVYLNSLVAAITDGQNKDGIYTSAKSLRNAEYPKIIFNTVAGEVRIEHRQIIQRARLYSVSGTMLESKNFNQRQVSWNISGLKKGIYILKIQDSQKQIFTEKLIVP